MISDETKVDTGADGPLEQLPVTLTVEETARVVGISRGLAYEAIRQGEIPSIRVGRRLLVPRVALAGLLESGAHGFAGGTKPASPGSARERL